MVNLERKIEPPFVAKAMKDKLMDTEKHGSS
jgi:hypothetical protein